MVSQSALQRSWLRYIQNDNAPKYGQLTYSNVQEGFWYDVAIV